MIIGAHSIIYSRRPEADRAFLLDVLRLPSVDVGGGWLIFGLPPAEVAVHPSDENDVHEFYLMCDDVDATIAAMEKNGIAASPIREAGWGRLTTLTLPGGGKLGIYEPLHPRPKQHVPKARAAKKKAKAAPRKKARAKKKSVSRTRRKSRR